MRVAGEAACAAVETLEMAAVPAGWYGMGSAEGEGRDEERPLHRVRVDAFKMARCQVTNREYAAFLKATGHPPPPFWTQPEFSAPEQPVCGPNWFEAREYCRWLSRVTGELYRLPTEAEWERAARGGAEGRRYPWGDADPAERPDYSRRWKHGPEPVGSAPPNDYGIFDLCENVHEWCLDWYDAGFYAASPEQNPVSSVAGCPPRCRRPGTAPAVGPARRSSRGGSWRHHIRISRCAARSAIPPAFQYADYGFRVVRSELEFADLSA